MGYYFAILGAIILLFSGWALCGRLKLLIVAERARGVIIMFDEKLRYVGQNRHIYYHPKIEFETAAGQQFVFTYGGGSRNKRGDVGDAIEVMYDPSKPENATVNSFLGMWAGPLAAAVLGGGSLAAGIQLIMAG